MFLANNFGRLTNMGRKSTKENKNVYQIAREECEFTRTAASDETNRMVTEKQIERIENGVRPYPEDVLFLSKAYKKPELCSYYCNKECAIGQAYNIKVETVHDLPRITLEMLSSLNTVNHDKDNLVNIAADGSISDEESADFSLFLKHLKEMSLTIDALRLWAEKNGVNASIDQD